MIFVRNEFLSLGLGLRLKPEPHKDDMGVENVLRADTGVGAN